MLRSACYNNIAIVYQAMLRNTHWVWNLVPLFVFLCHIREHPVVDDLERRLSDGLDRVEVVFPEEACLSPHLVDPLHTVGLQDFHYVFQVLLSDNHCRSAKVMQVITVCCKYVRMVIQWYHCCLLYLMGFFKCKSISNCCSKVLSLYWYSDWFKTFEELMFLILLNIFKNIVIEHGKDSWSF